LTSKMAGSGCIERGKKVNSDRANPC
jgi:hypothetical protein